MTSILNLRIESKANVLSNSVESVDSIEIIIYDGHYVRSEKLFRRIHGQLQPVEAGMALRKWIYLAVRHRLNQKFCIVSSVGLQFP